MPFDAIWIIWNGDGRPTANCVRQKMINFLAWRLTSHSTSSAAHSRQWSGNHGRWVVTVVMYLTFDDMICVALAVGKTENPSYAHM